MDNTSIDRLVTENMRSIFGFALTRVGNIDEAEALASDIVFRLLRSLPNLKKQENLYGFMWKIAENTYKDHLRKKYSKYDLTDIEDTPDTADSTLEIMVKNEDLNLLHRELSLLSKQYREVVVLYYIQDLSCSKIAEILGVSTEMVKYYLFRARKILKDGMNMERVYGEKSYKPNGFEIDFWGTKAGDSDEYRDFSNRRIKGNILTAAYYCPVTVQEISMELGVSVPYVEDEIRLLQEKQYLVTKNGKYLTNIPVFTEECNDAIDKKLDVVISSAVSTLVQVSDMFEERYKGRFSDENLMRWQKILLCIHYALMETDGDIQRNYGDLPDDGPYSLINGGGGKGVVWGRSYASSGSCETPHGIQGIYNGCPSDDGRGSVVAMNFSQTLHSQLFESNMTTPIVAVAADCFEYLPDEWQKVLTELVYVKNEKPNFAVWTLDEYDEIKIILKESIEILTELNREISGVAAEIVSDHAPAHIKRTAEYVGALVYRFNYIDKLVDALCTEGWLKSVEDGAKPGICVVMN